MLLLASLEGRVFLLSKRCGPLTFLKPRFVFSSFTCFFVQKYSTSEINFCIYHELGFKKCVCVCKGEQGLSENLELTGARLAVWQTFGIFLSQPPSARVTDVSVPLAFTWCYGSKLRSLCLNNKHFTQ